MIYKTYLNRCYCWLWHVIRWATDHQSPTAEQKHFAACISPSPVLQSSFTSELSLFLHYNSVNEYRMYSCNRLQSKGRLHTSMLIYRVWSISHCYGGCNYSYMQCIVINMWQKTSMGWVTLPHIVVFLFTLHHHHHHLINTCNRLYKIHSIIFVLCVAQLVFIIATTDLIPDFPTVATCTTVLIQHIACKLGAANDIYQKHGHIDHTWIQWHMVNNHVCS